MTVERKSTTNNFFFISPVWKCFQPFPQYSCYPDWSPFTCLIRYINPHYITPSLVIDTSGPWHIVHPYLDRINCHYWLILTLPNCLPLKHLKWFFKVDLHTYTNIPSHPALFHADKPKHVFSLQTGMATHVKKVYEPFILLSITIKVYSIFRI